jgi:hypothetical protein
VIVGEPADAPGCRHRGIGAIAVHAKDDAARAFYEGFGFVAAPTDPCHLFVLLKDVRAILKQLVTLGDMIGARSRTDRRSIPECVTMEHGDATH